MQLIVDDWVFITNVFYGGRDFETLLRDQAGIGDN
jgi:hypothetical protein